MPEPQILCKMCDNSVNKAVHGLDAILLVRLVEQPPKNVKNEICPHRCFAFYTRTARLKHGRRFCCDCHGISVCALRNV